MLGLAAAAIGSVVGPVSFSGSFDKTAAPSGGNVTSDSITVTVPSGNPGELTITYGTIVGIVSGIQYNNNAAGWIAWTDTATITVAAGTLQLRCGGMTAGESIDFSITDNFKSVGFGPYSLVAS